MKRNNNRSLMLEEGRLAQYQRHRMAKDKTNFSFEMRRILNNTKSSEITNATAFTKSYLPYTLSLCMDKGDDTERGWAGLCACGLDRGMGAAENKLVILRGI